MKITSKQRINAWVSVAGGFQTHEEALCLRLSGASLSASEDVNHGKLSALSFPCSNGKLYISGIIRAQGEERDHWNELDWRAWGWGYVFPDRCPKTVDKVVNEVIK